MLQYLSLQDTIDSLLIPTVLAPMKASVLVISTWCIVDEVKSKKERCSGLWSWGEAIWVRAYMNEHEWSGME